MEQKLVAPQESCPESAILEAATTRKLSAAELKLEQAAYAQQMAQLDREAWYTLGAAGLTTLLFWGVIALTYDSLITVAYMPLWFILSCIGGYLFSVLIVVFLVKFALKPCRLKVASYHELTVRGEGRP